jgi:hypothetical protein
MAASSSTIRILTEQAFAFAASHLAPRRLHDPSIGDELRHNYLTELSKFFPGKCITPHFVVERLLGYAKTLAYGENIAMMPAQGLHNQASFEIADDVLERSIRAVIGCIGIKPSAQQTQDETIRDIPEFANISGPVERHQIAHQLIRDNGRFAFVAGRAKQDVMLK